MMWHNIKKVHAILFIVWAVAMLSSTPSSAAEPYLEVGIGYKFNETETMTNHRDYGTAHKYSANIELGVDFDHGVSAGYRHRSQWGVGWPINDKKEYYVDEVFISKKFTF